MDNDLKRRLKMRLMNAASEARSIVAMLENEAHDEFDPTLYTAEIDYAAELLDEALKVAESN